MATKSAFSIVGLAHKLCLAFEAQGFTPELLNALAESPHILAELRNVQRGYSEIKPITHVIDCDANPFVPDGWEVEQHNKGGLVVWDPNKASLFLSKGQKGGSLASGYKLRKELSQKRCLNANVLDFLLRNQRLIPEDWRGKDVFFWGTIYRGADDLMYVRCLRGRGDSWDWGALYLRDDFDAGQPAAVWVR